MATDLRRRTSTVEASMTSRRVHRHKSWMSQGQVGVFRIPREQVQSKFDALRKDQQAPAMMRSEASRQGNEP